MISLHSVSSAPANPTPAHSTPACPGKEGASAESQDSVVIGKDPGGRNFIHKALYGLGKLTGGVAGLVPGAACGTVKESATADVPKTAANISKVLRTAGAVSGIAACAVAGAFVAGAAGAVAGLVAGPIAGAALGSALVPALHGLYTGIKGALKGSLGGAKTGAHIGGKIGDGVAHLVTDTAKHDLLGGITSRYGVKVRAGEEFAQKFEKSGSVVSFADLKRGLKHDLKEDKEGTHRVVAYGSDLGGSWKFTVDVATHRGPDGRLVIDNLKEVLR
ncbi:MAG: hypothetical protein RDV48_16060 [Candidatus Eremiobacteraeota bacterium]|nr:hypothetical protein [Candidatus Eremiobacteraeota bacterium]